MLKKIVEIHLLSFNKKVFIQYFVNIFERSFRFDNMKF